MNRLIVRGAKQLLTLHGFNGPRRGQMMRELGVIENGSLLIEDAVITEIGPTRRVENLVQARDAREIDATGCVVMPGFIDGHTHVVCGPPRLAAYEVQTGGATHEDVEESADGILTAVHAVRAASARSLEQETRRRLEGMLHHGTTTVEAKSGYGLDEKSEIKVLRASTAADDLPLEVLSTFLGAHVVPPEFEGKPDHYIDWLIVHMLPLVHRRKLARFVDVICGPGAFTIPQARRYLVAARELGFELKLHVEQFENTGGARLAVEMGAISADHLVQVSQEDVELIAGSWTIATLLPGPVLHLGLDQYAPARALIDAGAAVALASDFNVVNAPTYNMQLVLSLACTQMRMSPAEAITASTANAAWALGIADRVGTLESGKQADILIMHAQDYREIPYYCGINQVKQVIKKGVPI